MPCKIRLKHVPKIKGDEMAFGEATDIPEEMTKQTLVMSVNMSLNRNKRFSVYLRTLVHELLHVAFRIVERIHGRIYTDDSEHEFIERIEDAIILNLKVLKKEPVKGRKK